jgi:hypothetical protein
LEKLPITEILLQTRSFCRCGGIEDHDLATVTGILKQSGKRIVLAWDCLSKDREINEAAGKLERFIKQFDAIRFLDPGIGSFLKTNFPDCELELSLEHGSFNKHAILSWIKTFLPQLTRVVLSNQLPFFVIESLRSLITVEMELLGYGPLEIFYSRRKLLTKQLVSSNRFSNKLTLASDDRPNQKNQVFQTEKGTIVYYDKRLNIFEHHNEIGMAGINVLRLEYLYQDELKQLVEILEDPNWVKSLGLQKQGEFIQGFFDNNLSHKLFTELSNKHLIFQKETQAGVILETVKQHYCIIRLDQPTTLPQSIEICTPDGKNIRSVLIEIMDLKGQNHIRKVKPGVYQFSWIKYATPGSVIRFIR